MTIHHFPLYSFIQKLSAAVDSLILFSKMAATVCPILHAFLQYNLATHSLRDGVCFSLNFGLLMAILSQNISGNDAAYLLRLGFKTALMSGFVSWNPATCCEEGRVAPRGGPCDEEPSPPADNPR